jgi:hypothetical protein
MQAKELNASSERDEKLIVRLNTFSFWLKLFTVKGLLLFAQKMCRMLKVIKFQKLDCQKNEFSTGFSTTSVENFLEIILLHIPVGNHFKRLFQNGTRF